MFQGSASLPLFQLGIVDRAVFASISAMSVFALFSPLLWGVG